MKGSEGLLNTTQSTSFHVGCLRSAGETVDGCFCGSDGKVSAHDAADLGSFSRVGKIPWRRKWQPTPVLLPRKLHGWRSLVVYSPWGCKESDTTERLHFTLFYGFLPNIPPLHLPQIQ